MEISAPVWCSASAQKSSVAQEGRCIDTPVKRGRLLSASTLEHTLSSHSVAEVRCHGLRTRRDPLRSADPAAIISPSARLPTSFGGHNSIGKHQVVELSMGRRRA
eukprot:790345-Prymnesium_polylepis.1